MLILDKNASEKSSSDKNLSSDRSIEKSHSDSKLGDSSKVGKLFYSFLRQNTRLVKREGEREGEGKNKKRRTILHRKRVKAPIF